MSPKPFGCLITLICICLLSDLTEASSPQPTNLQFLSAPFPNSASGHSGGTLPPVFRHTHPAWFNATLTFSVITGYTRSPYHTPTYDSDQHKSHFLEPLIRMRIYPDSTKHCVHASVNTLITFLAPAQTSFKGRVLSLTLPITEYSVQ